MNGWKYKNKKTIQRNDGSKEEGEYFDAYMEETAVESRETGKQDAKMAL